jgi:hypothetical protein
VSAARDDDHHDDCARTAEEGVSAGAAQAGLAASLGCGAEAAAAVLSSQRLGVPSQVVDIGWHEHGRDRRVGTADAWGEARWPAWFWWGAVVGESDVFVLVAGCGAVGGPEFLYQFVSDPAVFVADLSGGGD